MDVNPSITIQAVYKVAKDEKEVREILEAIWREPEDAEKILNATIERNKDVYQFEKMLEHKVPGPS